jgi:myosin heavy subunit
VVGETRAANLHERVQANGMDPADAIEGYAEMKTSMAALKFTADEQKDIEDAVCAILHLGNVTFTVVEDADHCDLIGIGELMRAGDFVRCSLGD